MSMNQLLTAVFKKKYLFYYCFFLLCFFLLCYYFLQYQLLLIKVGCAHDSCDVFYWSSEYSYPQSPQQLADYLDYVDRYYPPNTRFINKDDPINPIVESSRKLAIRHIILRLKTITQKDYGEDIDKWIKEYASKEQQESRYERSYPLDK
jgi:hypothetical protein